MTSVLGSEGRVFKVNILILLSANRVKALAGWSGGPGRVGEIEL